MLFDDILKGPCQLIRVSLQKSVSSLELGALHAKILHSSFKTRMSAI